jgi:hypothetical protein
MTMGEYVMEKTLLNKYVMMKKRKNDSSLFQDFLLV